MRLSNYEVNLTIQKPNRFRFIRSGRMWWGVSLHISEITDISYGIVNVINVKPHLYLGIARNDYTIIL